MASSLTTVAKLDIYLGANTYTVGQKDAAVDAANEGIERYLDRTIAQQAHYRWEDGVGGNYLSIDHPPIVYLKRVAITTQSVLRIQNTSTDMVEAVVSASIRIPGVSQVIAFEVIGGTNRSSLTLAPGSYTTMALLAAAVINLTKGWTAIVENEESPYAIRPTTQALATSADSIYLEAPGGSHSAIIEDPAEGVIYSSTGWPTGPMSIYTHYMGGFLPIPVVLVEVANAVASDLLRRAALDSSLKSEKLGEHSWTAADVKDALAAYKEELASFKRITTA